MVDQPASPTQQNPIQLAGKISPAFAIEITGGAATARTIADAQGRFAVNVTLKTNQLNRLDAVAIDREGRRSDPTRVEVIHDVLPPAVTITAPADSARFTDETVTVKGRVSDQLSGIEGMTVLVNNLPATVKQQSRTEGTFERKDLPIPPDWSTIEAVATDKAGNQDTVSIAVFRDRKAGEPDPPFVSPPVSPTRESTIQLVGSAQPNLTIEIAVGKATVTTISEQSGYFSANVDLIVNQINRLTVTAIREGRRSMPTMVIVVQDALPPLLTIDSPADSFETEKDTIVVSGQVRDDLSGIAGVSVVVNERSAAIQPIDDKRGAFMRDEVPLALGWNDIVVVAADQPGNQVVHTLSVRRNRVRNVPSAPVVMQPTSPTAAMRVQISGNSEVSAQIEIAGGAAKVTAAADTQGLFSAEVILKTDRVNRLYVTAINAFGRSSPAQIDIIQDATPPQLFIDAPMEGAELMNDTITVLGRIGDVLSGALGIDVTVNGQPANVDIGIGTNGTFERMGVPLQLGDNLITATATDAAGNSVTQQITVKRIDLSNQPRMTVVSGNNQKGSVLTTLPQPISVRVVKADGSPFANKLVTFEVVRSDGRLSQLSPVAGDSLKLQVFTDSEGLATVHWKLGSDAGFGNNRVSVTSRSIAGPVLFCATAEPNIASQINIGTGNNQRAEVDGPAAEPLTVWVSDGVNGIADVPVTFTVIQGGGLVNAAASAILNTDATGHVQVQFTLGPIAGNHLVQAAITSDAATPVTFFIRGLERDSTIATSFSGVVLDNANQPIQGATCEIQFDGGVILPATVTDSAGVFSFVNIPSGAAQIVVDGATAVNGKPVVPGSFPPLSYETVIVPNVENTLATPVLLPRLNPNNARLYDGTQDVELTVEGMPGLKFIVKAGSVTLPDSTKPSPANPVTLTLNQVHFDEIPMPMPDGSAPPYAGTLGPPNTKFDPPVQIVFPNLTALPPGATNSFLSFNHETHKFEVVATGRISEDGTVWVSDPGTGITIAGWHGPRSPAAGSSTQPCPDPSQCPSRLAGGDGTDPVHLFNGEFHISYDDLRLKGRGMDLVWTRSYRSRFGLNTALGNGWDFSYNIYLEPQGEGFRVFSGENRGNDIYLQHTPGVWTRPEFFNVLTRNDNGTYTLTFPDKQQWHFRAFDGSPAQGKIDSLVDRNGNRIAFHYDAQGRMMRITDTLDKNFHLKYNAQGFIESVRDTLGRLVKYAYYDGKTTDGNFGDLKSATSPAVVGTPNGNDFPNGKTISYTYSTGRSDERLNHNLLTITDGRRNDPNDPTFGQGAYLKNFYADRTGPDDYFFDKLMRQDWGGDRVDIDYVPRTPTAEDPTLNKTIVKDRNGNRREFFFDARNRLIKHRRYTGNPKPRPSDPVFFETIYEYDYNSNLTREVHPNGNMVEYDYELQLNPHASQRFANNLRKIRRLPGTHAPAGDQQVIEEAFEYATDFGGCCGYAFVKKHVDGRGHETIHEYDDFGNRKKTTQRIKSIVEDFDYNQFGQMTAHTLPDNGSNHRRRDAFTYYDNGPNRGYLHREIVDTTNFALTTTHEYDLAGNIIKTTDPRGHDTQFVVNQLDQVVREISREVFDSPGLRYQHDYFYDANDNLIRQDIQNVDEQGRLQPNIHFTTTYEYEILNYLIRKIEEVAPGDTIVTEYEYDKNRNRTLVRFGEATKGSQPTNIVRMAYDERDLLFRETRAFGDPNKSTTQYDYDGNANLVIKRHGIEKTPRIFSYVYDGYDRQVTETDPMGNVMGTNYDANNNRVRYRTEGELQDIAGNANNVRLDEQAYAYDAMDRLTRTDIAFFDTDTQTPIGDSLSTSQIFYSANSQIIREVDDNGHETLYTYDTANRRSVVTDDKNNTMTFGYDANDNIIAVTEVEKSDLGNPDEAFVTRGEYDNLDRTIKTTDNAGNINEYRYDSRHNRTLHSDALRLSPNGPGNRTKMDYDGLNRLIRTARYLTSDGTGAGAVVDSIVTSQTWDHDSRLTGQTDDNGNTTAYTYDALNRKIATTYADGTVHTTIYDVHDNAITVRDANGSVATCSYDLNNRLIAKSIARGTGVLGTTFENFQYDGRNRLILARDDDSEVTRSYNSLSLVTRETLNGQTTASLYDGMGNKLQCTYPGGRVISTTYDELDRKKLISDQNGTIASYDYIGPSRVERRDYANNTRMTYAYDDVKRIIRTTHSRDPKGTPVMFDDRSYTWDQMYNKTSRIDSLSGLAHAYQYDSIYRLIRSTKTPSDSSPEIINYTLDGVGNRTTVSGGPNPGNYVMNNATPEPADFQLNQYTITSFDARLYDRNGNLIRIDNGLPNQRNFVYDYRNQMIEHMDLASGATARYVYDAFGRRIEKVVNDGTSTETTRYFYDDWREVEEQNASGATQASDVYGLYVDEVLNMRRDVDNNGVLEEYFYHSDELYNVLAVTNIGGIVVERYDYEDYGLPLFLDALNSPFSQSRLENPYYFTGRRFDVETSLYYYRSRYLEPQAGRFTIRDKIGTWGDENNIGNPYVYVQNNPVTYEDPTGQTTYRCKRPLQACAKYSEGQKCGAEVPRNPFFHEYICVERYGSMRCGGQTASGFLWSPGGPTTPEEDYFDPNYCRELPKIEDNYCFDKCVLSAIRNPGRPYYGIIGPATNCQEWAEEVLSACKYLCR
jgi:RHS repeat-associated protein